MVVAVAAPVVVEARRQAPACIAHTHSSLLTIQLAGWSSAGWLLFGCGWARFLHKLLGENEVAASTGGLLVYCHGAHVPLPELKRIGRCSRDSDGGRRIGKSVVSSLLPCGCHAALVRCHGTFYAAHEP